MKWVINQWDKICDKYYKDEKEIAPLGNNMHWRKSFHLSPSFNLFYYVVMGIFLFFSYKWVLSYVDMNHWFWDKLHLTNMYSNVFFTLMISISIVGLLFFFIGKIFYHKIKLAKEKPKALLFIGDKRIEKIVNNILEKSEHIELINWEKPSFDIEYVIEEDFDYIITDTILPDSDMNELNKYNIRSIGLWKHINIINEALKVDKLEPEERADKITTFLRRAIQVEAPSLLKGAIWAKIVRFIPKLIDKAIYQLSKGVNAIGTINSLKALIFIGSLFLIAYIGLHFIFKPLLIKKGLLFVLTLFFGRMVFNTIYYIWTQVENISISISNTLTELFPMQRLHFQLKKMNNAKSLHDWYYKPEGFRDFLKENLENEEWIETMKYQAMNGQFLDIITSLSVYLISLIVYGSFFVLGTEKTPFFLGKLSIRHARYIFYVPVHLIILTVYSIQWFINYKLFYYGCMFFISIYLLMGSSLIVFIKAMRHIQSIIIGDYTPFVKIGSVSYDLIFLLLGIFLINNVVMLFMNSVSWKYYKGYTISWKLKNSKKDKEVSFISSVLNELNPLSNNEQEIDPLSIHKKGAIHKYILDWRKGASLIIVKTSLMLALVASLTTTLINTNDFLNKEFNGLSLNSISELMDKNIENMKKYEANEVERNKKLKSIKEAFSIDTIKKEMDTMLNRVEEVKSLKSLENGKKAK